MRLFFFCDLLFLFWWFTLFAFFFCNHIRTIRLSVLFQLLFFRSSTFIFTVLFFFWLLFFCLLKWIAYCLHFGYFSAQTFILYIAAVVDQQLFSLLYVFISISHRKLHLWCFNSNIWFTAMTNKWHYRANTVVYALRRKRNLANVLFCETFLL